MPDQLRCQKHERRAHVAKFTTHSELLTVSWDVQRPDARAEQREPCRDFRYLHVQVSI